MRDRNIFSCATNWEWLMKEHTHTHTVGADDGALFVCTPTCVMFLYAWAAIMWRFCDAYGIVHCGTQCESILPGWLFATSGATTPRWVDNVRRGAHLPYYSLTALDGYQLETTYNKLHNPKNATSNKTLNDCELQFLKFNVHCHPLVISDCLLCFKIQICRHYIILIWL